MALAWHQITWPTKPSLCAVWLGDGCGEGGSLGHAFGLGNYLKKWKNNKAHRRRLRVRFAGTSANRRAVLTREDHGKTKIGENEKLNLKIGKK